MHDEQWANVLRRYHARFQELVASEDEMGLKRACSDGQLTMLLMEVALRLSPAEREVIEAMIVLHNYLWSLPAGMSVKVIPPGRMPPMEHLAPSRSSSGVLELKPLIAAYSVREAQARHGSGLREGYGWIVALLRSFCPRLSVIVMYVRSSLDSTEKSLAWAQGEHRQRVLERRAVFEEFLSFYGDVV